MVKGIQHYPQGVRGSYRGGFWFLTKDHMQRLRKHENRGTFMKMHTSREGIDLHMQDLRLQAASIDGGRAIKN